MASISDSSSAPVDDPDRDEWLATELARQQRIAGMALKWHNAIENQPSSAPAEPGKALHP